MPAEYVETITVPASDLTEYPGNPKRHDADALLGSLKWNGQYRSVIARRLPTGELQLLAGHGTTAAADQLTQPVRVEVIACTDDEARRIVLADNAIGPRGGYDDQALVALLDEANAHGGLTATGYDEDLYRELLDRVGSENPYDWAPADGVDPDEHDTEPPEDPLTQPGDVWQLGPHRILCGDSRLPADVARLLDGEQIGLAFTSPPYASQRKYDESSGFKPIPPDEYVDWFEPVQANIRHHIAPDGSWFVNIKEHAEDGQRHLYVKDLTIAHVRRWGWLFVDELCWVDTRNGVPGGWPNRFKDAWEPVFHFSADREIKFHPLANGERSANVFSYSPDNARAGTGSGLLGGEKRNGMGDGIARPSNVLHIAAAAATGVDHSAQFPIDLPRWFIRAYSDPGDTVFDPFMGSGTTLLAADMEGRTAYGCEISPAYCDVIARRWQQTTGGTPLLNGEPVNLMHEPEPAST